MAGYPGPLPQIDGVSVKVAIPRLQRPDTSQRERQRVKQACAGCRKHKIRCSGEKPRCEHCIQLSQACVYTPARRDRLKIAEDHCGQMAALLRDLRENSSAENSARIDELLQSLEDGPEGYTPGLPRTVAADNASESHSPVRNTTPTDTTPLDTDYMSLCDSDVFDSSPTVAQPYATDARRVNVPETEVQYTEPQSPAGRVDVPCSQEGQEHNPGAFHGQAAVPWQAYYGDFADTYGLPEHFPPNQLPPWQYTSHTFLNGYPPSSC